MMMKPSAKRAALLAAALVLVVALTTAWLGLRAKDADRDANERSPASARASVREPSASAGTAGANRHPAEPGTQQQEERRAALDLVERMRGPAQKFPVTRMAYEGEEFPKDLLDELAAMNAEQFQIVLLAIGKDRTIHAGTRTTLGVNMLRAWMNRQQDAGKPQLEMVLGIIEELFPEFPRGHDVLPVLNVIDPGARWDPAAMSDFIVKHWDRWGGPDDRNTDLMRQAMLRSGVNPQAAVEQMKTLGMPRDLRAAGQELASGGSVGPQAIVAAVQQMQAELGDDAAAAELRAGMVAGLGDRLTDWSPAEVDTWLQASDLSAAEQQTLLERMILPRNTETALDWIHWMEPRVPQDAFEKQVSRLGGHLAFDDLAAAERWITALPEGQTRTFAVRGFLEVAKDPVVRERVGALAAE